MRSVPAQTRIGLGLAVLAASVAIVALPSLSQGSRAGTHAYTGLAGGVPLQSARCVQWVGASDAERSNVAAALSHSVGGATPYGRGTTLSRSQAQTLFDRACSSPIARHWLLYELYIRAAGFRSYMR